MAWSRYRPADVKRRLRRSPNGRSASAPDVSESLSAVGCSQGEDAQRQRRPGAVVHPEHHWPDAPGRQRPGGRNRSNPQGCDHAGRDLPWLPHHPDRRSSASRRCRAILQRRCGGPLGGGCAGRRRDELQRKELAQSPRRRVVSLRRVAHGRNLSPPRQGPARNHHDGRGSEGAHRKVDGAKNHVDARAV